MQKLVSSAPLLPSSLRDKIADKMDAHDLKHSFDDALTDNTLYNIKQKGFETIDQWQNIENNVHRFNRATIINDPEKKGELLYAK